MGGGGKKVKRFPIDFYKNLLDELAATGVFKDSHLSPLSLPRQKQGERGSPDECLADRW